MLMEGATLARQWKRRSPGLCHRGGKDEEILVSLCLAAVILLFHGCASKQTSVPLSERAQPGVAAGEQPQAPEGLAGEKGNEGAISEEELAKAERERNRKAAEEAAAAHLQDVYFDFDSYNVRSEDMPVLRKMAELAWRQTKPSS